MKENNILKLVKQNRLFLLVVFILFISFSLVIYFGMSQIYDREVEWRYGNVANQLQSTVERIKAFFSHPKHDLFFLRDLPDTKDYVNGDFKSILYRNRVMAIFYDFAQNYRHYYQMRIIDSTGREVVRIDNERDGPIIIADSNLQDEKHQPYFEAVMKLSRDEIYVCGMGLNVKQEEQGILHAPTVRLATPLFNSKSERKGTLALDIYLSAVLELSPQDMFIQTEDGNSMSLKSDRTIDFRKSEYKLEGSEGELLISEVEAIHYSTVEFLPGERLIVAAHHDHSLLKAELNRLIVISIVVLLFFLCLLLIIGYINLSRHQKLIDAQRAIIFSLAGLTEWRDPETGAHLERTTNYSVALAKQLHHNKKYRKIITNEFIEDLQFATPLHDMGKVGIRDSILLKAGKLTNEEYEAMKEHVRIGKQLLQDVIGRFKLEQSVLAMGLNICAYHHEKYNGTGYAEGLKGEEIPLEARIFALCDAYDAIRTKRPYKDELPHEEAVRRIKSASGEHFDPDIVDTFLTRELEFAEISKAYKH